MDVRLGVGTATVPTFLRRALYTALLAAGAISLPYLGQYGPLPTTVILDAWIIVFAAYCILRRRISVMPFLLLVIAYTLTRIVPALAISAPLVDFLQAYRWLFYLAAFAIAVGQIWQPIKPLIGFTWALLSMALLKAAATFVLLGPGERPGLLLENNFELALFGGLIVVLYPYLGRSRPWLVASFGLLTLLAGSRSGAVVLLIVVLFAVTQAKTKNLLFRYILVGGIPAAGVLVLSIFAERASNGRSVDRLNFFNVFLHDVSSWNIGTWIFGTTPITPLSPSACHSLAFYQNLFASTGDGTCYSVILHAFLMRVVFDSGLLGLLLAFGGTAYLLFFARVRPMVALSLLAIALANSFSVSGLNNPYVALPILLAIMTAPKGPELGEDGSHDMNQADRDKNVATPLRGS